MSILDKHLEFSDSQAVTVTAISTHQYDSGGTVVTKNIGGTPGSLYLVVQVDVTATAGGAATLTIELISDSVSTLNSSPTVHYATAAIPVASLTAGTTLVQVGLPAGAYERYIGVRYTVATGPLTAGAFSAFLVRDLQTWTPMYAHNPEAN